MLWYVAISIGHLFGTPAGVLCGEPEPLECVHGSNWRSWTRSENLGVAAGGDRGQELHSGYNGRWSAADSSGSHPFGAGVPGLSSTCSSTSWWWGGHVEGSEPLGYFIGDFFHGGNYEFSDYKCGGGQEAEVFSSAGARGRHRVSLRTRRCQDNLLLQVCGGDGRPSGRSRRSFDRTTVSISQEGGDETGYLCGLRCVGTLLTQTHAGSKVSILSPTRRRQLLEQDDGRSELLQTLAGFVSSSSLSVGDAGFDQPQQPGSVGSLGGEVELFAPWMLAFDRGGRGQGKRRAHVKGARQDKVGDRSRRTSSIGLGGCEAVECGVAEGPSRQGLLDRASHCSCHNLGGKGAERLAEDTYGRTFRRSTSWRFGFIENRAEQGEHQRGVRRREEGSEQEERGKEKKKAERQGGVEILQIQRQREGQWKRWRSSGFWRWKILRWSRRGLLRLEQWQWFVRRPRPRGKVHGQDPEGTQVFSVWVTRASKQRLFFEKDLKERAWIWMWAMVTAGTGGEVQKGQGKMEGELTMRSTGRSDFRGGMHTRNDTKRKRFTGDDPPGEEDPPKKKIHVEGDYLTVEEYFKLRTFTFLHHFSGKRDRLSEAIMAEAEKKGVKVITISVDKEINGEDLAATHPFGHHLVSAGRGDLDGYHSGFPCHTFSKLLWRQAPGMPGPVRSKERPYGLEGLSDHRQRACDLGTVLMARSVLMAHAIMEHDKDIKVPAFVTMENPPPSDLPDHLSAWHMPEMVDLLEKVPTWRTANYNTCAFQHDLKVGEKHYKPGMIGGTLPGILSLGKRCSCGVGKLHEPITGKDKSSKAAAYPKAFCEEYARLAVEHFVKMGLSEFWEGRSRLMEKSLEVLRMKAAEEESLAARAWSNSEEIEKGEDFKRWKAHNVSLKASESRAGEGVTATEQSGSSGSGPGGKPKESEITWKTGPGKYGMLKEPKKKDEVPRALVHVGGLRNPHKSVQNLPTVQALGLHLRGAWERFIKSWPDALEVAEKYGTKDCTNNPKLVTKWKEELRRLFGARGESTVRLRGKDEYVSPIDYKLLDAWRSRAGDPEIFVAGWLEKGVPLGIEEEIEVCGIFPLAEQEESNPGLEKDNDLALASSDLKNYKSVEEDKEGAEIELARYEEEKYLKRITRREAEEVWGGGTISRLGMVVKKKESGEIKRRIAIDLRRSGGNYKSKLPEKLILPRLVDFIKGLKEPRRNGTRVEHMVQGYGLELALVDIHLHSLPS